jgi:alkylation response protein AidB-like acyl-CoA dehydrogenase
VDLENFRREVAAWITAADAPAPRDVAAWERRLGERGWSAPSWPREYGGAGLERGAAKIIADELRQAGVRRRYDPGLMMVGPVAATPAARTLSPRRRADSPTSVDTAKRRVS